MRKFSSVFLIAIGFSLASCSDKSEEFKNDETYFVGEWSAATPNVIVNATPNQQAVTGLHEVYSFQKGGKLEITPFIITGSLSGTDISSGGATLHKPVSLWSYIPGARQLLLFAPQKTVYNIIQVDKNNFTAIGNTTNLQWNFTRK